MTTDGTDGEKVANATPAPAVLNVEVVDDGGDLPSESERYERSGTVTRNGVFEDLCARDRVIRRSVVIRRLARGTAHSSSEERRFARAARLQAQLEHPAIVPIYDIGEVGDVGDMASGAQTMIFPDVRSVSLRRVLDARASGDKEMVRKFSRTALLQAFLQLCLATAYAHARGVVHRNIQPEAVALGDHGEVYLLDWSLAKPVQGPYRPGLVSIDSSTAEIGATLPGQTLGTPGYASPEQLVGGEADARSDVYALGSLLFEILTGSPLHSGESAVEKVRTTQVGVNACPSQRAPKAGIPEAFDTVCVRATATDPKLRYPSARELHDAIERTLEAALEAGRRTELASRHAELAESLAMRALTASSGHYELRAQALREAGRAFALNPKSPGARRALLTLLKEEPPDLPPEAQAEMEAEASDQARAVGRFAMLAYGAFGLIFAPVALSGVRSWPGFAFTAVSVAATVGVAAFMSRMKNPTGRVGLLLAFTSFTAIASTSGFYGALVLAPLLATANVVCMGVGLDRRYRPWVLLMGLASMLVPFAFERFGLLPQSYRFGPGTITVLPVVRDLHEGPVRIGLFLSTLAAIVAPTLFTWRLSNRAASATERMHVYGWQLRRLLPKDAYSGITEAEAVKRREGSA